jgi:hypothetical protein
MFHIPMHGGSWWYCADTGSYENHWVTSPQDQLIKSAMDLWFL